MKKIRIATRSSELALWQAHYIKNKLLNLYPDYTIELVPLQTQGDHILDVSLSKIGGKGLFIKELEQALLDNQADIAVHSVKDMPAQLADDFTLAAFCAREEPKDALLALEGRRLMDLKENPVIGTSSLRRQAQIQALRVDCECKILRGNVPTRVRKLLNGEYDAIVLAAAGLQRLNLDHYITQLFTIDELLPAIGQGALGIECRAHDNEILTLLSPLNEPTVAVCVQAERAMNARLGGSCQVAVAGYACLTGVNLDIVRLQGRVLNKNGTVVLDACAQSDISSASILGDNVAQQLLQQGADKIIAEQLW